MYYDLNVPLDVNSRETQRTVLFLIELGYETIALNHSINGRVPPKIVNAIPSTLPFSTPSTSQILRRCTLNLSDPDQNHRLAQLSSTYDIFALRPTNEKSFQQACHSLECDIISLDLSIRHPYYFQIKTVKSALERGIKFEICYASGILNADNGASRRNLISNATQLIRATRGRGIIISSEARKAIACRGPADIINLATLWGLGQERANEAVGKEARQAVVQAQMKRRSFRGVIDVVHGGSKPDPPPETEKGVKARETAQKRKAEEAIDYSAIEVESGEPKAISKREQKRRAKKARLDAMEEHFKGKENEKAKNQVDAADAADEANPAGKE